MWQRRLGHLSLSVVHHIVETDSWSNGPKEESRSIVDNYVGCDREKVKTRSFKPISKKDRAESQLQLGHTDVCRPSKVKSPGNSTYFLTFIDSFLRMTFVNSLKRESEVDQRMYDFAEYVERQTGDKIKRLYSENGGAYA